MVGARAKKGKRGGVGEKKIPYLWYTVVLLP